MIVLWINKKDKLSIDKLNSLAKLRDWEAWGTFCRRADQSTIALITWWKEERTKDKANKPLSEVWNNLSSTRPTLALFQGQPWVDYRQMEQSTSVCYYAISSRNWKKLVVSSRNWNKCSHLEQKSKNTVTVLSTNWTNCSCLKQKFRTVQPSWAEIKKKQTLQMSWTETEKNWSFLEQKLNKLAVLNTFGKKKPSLLLLLRSISRT